jgi:hypothetical protein
MKRKLLFAIVALMCSVGTWAQKDITSTYITNATLSNGTTGWTVSNFNAPQQGNNTVGYASECYAGWDNLNIESYSLLQTITLPKGSYRLVNYSFFRQGLKADTDASKSLAFLKAGSNQVAIKTLGSITGVGGYANLQAEGANCFDSKMYRNVVEFNIDADNTEIEIGLVGTFDLKQSWIIAGMFELFDLNDLASVDSPTDMTYAITNSGFEYRNTYGWTTVNDETHKKSFWYMDNTALSNKAGIGWVESYEGGGIDTGRQIYQTLTGLDNGLYEVTVYGHLQQGAGSNGFYVYANDDRTAIGSTDQDYSVRTTVTDGTLTIKLATDGCNGNWAAFDKVRLKFYGDPLEAYKVLLQGVVDKAQALVDGNTIPNAAESALQTVINNNDNDDNAFTEESEFNTAMANINAAYDTYKALEGKYALWLEVKNGAEAMALVENNNPTATSTLSSAVSTQNTAAEGATTNEGINSAIAALRTAILAYATDAVPTSGNRFDLTCLLTNHDLTGLPTWAPADGWLTEQSGGNSQVMNSGDLYFYEYWSDAAVPSTSGYTVYLQTTLPKGVYSMEAKAFATDQRSDADKEENPINNGITFSANEVDGTTITADALADASISFYQASESEVKLGLKAHAGNTRNWMGIGYVKLFKVANDQAAGVYATVRSSANSALASSDYTNVTGKERSDLATLAAVETPADYVEAIENLQDANSAFVSAKTTYDTWVNTSLTKKTTNIGTGVFQLNETTNNSLYSAYETARNHEITSSTTASDVAGWNDAVSTAINNYNNQPLNAPEASKRYNVSIVDDGQAWNGNAVTFIAGGRTDMGNFAVQYLASANAYMCQALKFTAVEGEANTYKISAIRADGGEQYLTTGSTYEGGNNTQIRTTDDASKASWVKIQATATSGQFQLLNVSDGNKVIGRNSANPDNGMYTDGNVSFTIAEASQASVSVNLAAGKYGTRIFPFTPTLPSEVKAYSCEAVDGSTLTLVEVDSPEANTPYIIYSEYGYSGEALTGWGTATADSYTEGLLTGVYTNAVVPVNSYVLQTQGGYQAFYKVIEEGKKSAANRCYLTLPAESPESTVKAFYLNFSDETAINAVEAAKNENAAIFNLAGQRVSKAQKGLYIVNGKKVTVK